MFNYYSSLSSEVYDLDKHIGRSFGDVEFYTERMAKFEGPILEPGVGNGRILIPLMEKGLKVDGLDISKEMLDRCRRNCIERDLHPNLIQGNMESFALNAIYDAIIIPTGTFLLLHRRDDSLRALSNFHDHLKDGGRLFIDLILQKDRTVGKTEIRTWKSGEDIITLESRLTEVDEVHQYSVSHHRYEKWRKGKLIQTELERFPLRWFGIEEFKFILESVGFSEVVLSADYQYGQYPTKTTEIITFEGIAAKKK